MLHIRKSEERGYADHGWLKTHHTFSFADYYDPRHMGFRSLRVINEDLIDGGKGFGSHPHKDMEIITYVIKGALRHKDSMGTESIIKPGEVQRMSAGSGVVHSEHAVGPEDVHLFQVWIQPDRSGEKPGYGQKSFETELAAKDLVLVVSKDGREGSIEIKQDADMYVSRLKAGKELEYAVRPGRGIWGQVAKGQLRLGNKVLSRGDGFSSEDAQVLRLQAAEDSELILFDLL
jgi:quercetin 2,3-dioxygenase